MLETEDFKKIFDNIEVEGYSLKEYSKKNIIINFTKNTWSINYNIDTDAWAYDKYSDFLQRVTEGINHMYAYDGSGVYAVEQEADMIRVKENNDTLLMLFYHTVGSTDQAKEEAIKHILGKL